MKLSEALRHGITLRSESHQERFINVEGRGLCSDAWGAAVEAVMPTVAEFNWNHRDPVKFERAMEAFRAVQQHYFSDYWNMPARCPGAKRSVLQQGGRIVTHRGKGSLKLYEQGKRAIPVGGITSECDKVSHMAGMIDHLFYKHNWSREEVLEAVEWYENTRSLSQFEHYASVEVNRAIRQQLTEPLSAYPKLAKKVS